MIGKIRNQSFKLLVFFISTTILIGSLYISNYSIFIIFCLSLLASIYSTKFGIYLITKLNLFQNIQKEILPKHSGKNSIPTMGGTLIIPLFLLIVLLIDFPSLLLKLILFFSVLGYFLIGLIDDLLSFQKKSNQGLSALQKFIPQSLIATLFIFSLKNNDILNFNLKTLNDTFFEQSILLTIIFLLIVGLSNAVNLTDGLDGLAAGCSALTFCGLGTELLLRNDENLMVYIMISFSMCGLCLGFLKYNKFPAKIFLGDTGSLSLGAIIGLISVLTNSFYTTLVMCGIFIIETLSVICQVSYFKITKRFFLQGKRLFLMSPLHHHYELKGIKEKKIVDIFWIVNTMLVILVIVLKMHF